MFRYEHRTQSPIALRHFLRRLLYHALVVAAIGAGSLFMGMAGYVAFERLSWLDAFLNAAMLLGGMGPIHSPVTSAGKFFAGCYALYSGLVFLAASGVLAAPILHRALHTLHWDKAK